MEGIGVELAAEGGQGEDRRGATVAKGNDDDAEMDCAPTTNGELDLCF